MASHSPIQVVLNANDFRTDRDKPAGGGATDFFAGDDAGFARHRTAILSQLKMVRSALSKDGTEAIGYARVTLRQKAWAKSHRPVAKLFKEDRVQIVGGDDLGQMLVEVTARALDEISEEVRKAEPETRWTERNGKRIANPTARRSEVGALETVHLYGPSDKRRFSVAKGVEWLRNSRTGGSYRIELFRDVPRRKSWQSLEPRVRYLFKTLLDGLSEFGPSIGAYSLTGRIGTPALAIRLGHGVPDGSRLFSVDVADPTPGGLAPFDDTIERHERVLDFLERHPLVRRISLPTLPVRSGLGMPRAAPAADLPLPHPTSGVRYPRVGVVDGGIGPALDPWIVWRTGLIAEAHREPEHGSFIGGLLVAGQSMNDAEIAPERDGCELVDIDIYPGEDTNAFEQYFGASGSLAFFDELSVAVETARRDHGVRIFNLSINHIGCVQMDGYSEEAQCLDRIADEHDAIIVISAGNLDSRDQRPEWPADPTTALGQLAAVRSDSLQRPAESVRNISVGALNAPGLGHSLALAPARYSRRGPGLRTGVKPDFGHIGGSGTARCSLGSGLFSVKETGEVYADCGTSFAAPLVAKTLAALDIEIAEDVSRETLIALAIHNSQVPDLLLAKELSGVARHLVGFGVPSSAQAMLTGDDHSITLVFASRLMRDQQLIFPIQWPACLTRPGGKCRGQARLSLVTRPPLDYRFGAEFVRVNLDASLQQWNALKNDGRGGWEGQLKAAHRVSGSGQIYESDRIEHDLKWSPTKLYVGSMPNGRGSSSDWRLAVEYTTRSQLPMPEEGVQFTAILTIADTKAEEPVFTQMRQSLQTLGARIADIRQPIRVRQST